MLRHATTHLFFSGYGDGRVNRIEALGQAVGVHVDAGGGVQVVEEEEVLLLLLLLPV